MDKQHYLDFFQRYVGRSNCNELRQDRLRANPDDALIIDEALQQVFGEKYTLPTMTASIALNDPAPEPVVETAAVVVAEETPKAEDVLEAIVEPQEDTSVSTMATEPFDPDDFLTALMRARPTTRDLPANERQQILLNFLTEAGKGQILKQLIEGAGYMAKGDRLPYEEYQKLVVNTIKNDLRALKQIRCRKTKSKRGQTIYLYELVEWEVDHEEVAPPTSDEPLIPLSALADLPKEELLKIIAKLASR